MPIEINKRPKTDPAKIIKAILLVVLAVIIVAAAIYFVTLRSNSLSFLDADYQAVFLTNGQVYFGQVDKKASGFVLVSDMYYLQNQTIGIAETAGQDVALIKLGNEVHGPTDAMYINQERILFIEDLQNGSRVVQAIEEYKMSH